MATANRTRDLNTVLAAAAGGERVIKHRDGQRLAVIGSEDLERLEGLDAAEDLADGEAIAAALAEQEASGEPPTPHGEVLASLGLTS